MQRSLRVEEGQLRCAVNEAMDTSILLRSNFVLLMHSTLAMRVEGYRKFMIFCMKTIGMESTGS